jgi:DNA-binding transcriptional LysR family regulator
LRDLVEMPMVLLDLPVSRETFLNFFRMHGLQPRIRFRPKSFEMVRSLVGAGFGFSFAYLRLKSEQSYQGNRLVRRRIVEKLPPSRVCLAVPRNSRPTRITRAFSEVCREVYHEAETI